MCLETLECSPEPSLVWSLFSRALWKRAENASNWQLAWRMKCEMSIVCESFKTITSQWKTLADLRCDCLFAPAACLVCLLMICTSSLVSLLMMYFKYQCVCRAHCCTMFLCGQGFEYSVLCFSSFLSAIFLCNLDCDRHRSQITINTEIRDII